MFPAHPHTDEFLSSAAIASFRLVSERAVRAKQIRMRKRPRGLFEQSNTDAQESTAMIVSFNPLRDPTAPVESASDSALGADRRPGRPAPGRRGRRPRVRHPRPSRARESDPRPLSRPSRMMWRRLRGSADRGAKSLPAAAGTTPRLGSGVLGDYRIVREVGRGGMGVVFEAVQVSALGRRGRPQDPSRWPPRPIRAHLQRFLLEARAAAQLHHPHIVPIHAVGCDRGVHYYAMQFVEGRSLAEMVRENRGRRSNTRAPTSVS